MPRPIYEPSIYTRARGTERNVDTLFRRGPGPWQIPELLNGFADPGGRYGILQYRFGSQSELEFDGFLDVSGASSGTIAFYILEDWRPLSDADLLTSVRNSSTFSAAMLTIDRDDGSVICTWPIT